MAIPEMNTDEIIATLKKSSLSTVIVEGKTDAIVYRRFEDDLSDPGISLFSVGGRIKVIDLWRRRSEFSHISTLFIIDRDEWVFWGVPDEFRDRQEIILTDGYSIENDLIRDGEIEKLLLSHERTSYQVDIAIICDWFANAIQARYEGSDALLDIHPNYITQRGSGIMNTNLVRVIYNEQNSNIIRSKLESEYLKMLRGKTLLDCLVRYLSCSTRTPKHNKMALLEASAIRRGAYYSNILNKLAVSFGIEITV